MAELPCNGVLTEGTLDLVSEAGAANFYPAGTKLKVVFESGPFFTCELTDQPTVRLRLLKRMVRLTDALPPVKEDELRLRVRTLLKGYFYAWAFNVAADGKTVELYQPVQCRTAAHLLKRAKLPCTVVMVDKVQNAAKARAAAADGVMREKKP